MQRPLPLELVVRLADPLQSVDAPFPLVCLLVTVQHGYSKVVVQKHDPEPSWMVLPWKIEPLPENETDY